MNAKEKADELIDKMYYIGRYDDKEDYNDVGPKFTTVQAHPILIGMIVGRLLNITGHKRKLMQVNFGAMSSWSCSLCKVAYNVLQVGDSWRFSRQFCQCAVIFLFFFFFFCAVG